MEATAGRLNSAALWTNMMWCGCQGSDLSLDLDLGWMGWEG